MRFLKHSIFLLCCAALLAGAAGNAAGQAGESHAARIEGLLAHADTCYWLGQAEKGDMAAYRRGLDYLEDAERLVKELPVSAKRDSLLARISGLRNDLSEQAEVAHDTVNAVFPLLRFLAWQAPHYELVDDPRVMATVRGTRGLVDTILDNWKNIPQLDVAYNSGIVHGDDYRPIAARGESVPSAAMQNEMAYIFNLYPKFFNHNENEIMSTLTDVEAARFYSSGLDTASADKLCEAFGISRLLQATVRETDVDGKDWFYVAEGRMFEKSKGMTDDRMFVFGFTRDRRDVLSYLLLAVAALILLPLLATRWLAGRGASPAPAALGLVVGIGASCASAVTTGAILPSVELLAVYGFWGAILLAAALSAAPLAAGFLLRGILVVKLDLADWKRQGMRRAFFLAIVSGAAILPAVGLFCYRPPGLAAALLVAWVLPGVLSALLLAAASGRGGAASSLSCSCASVAGIVMILVAFFALTRIPHTDLSPLAIAELLAVALTGGLLTIQGCRAFRRGQAGSLILPSILCFSVFFPAANMTLEPVILTLTGTAALFALGIWRHARMRETRQTDSLDNVGVRQGTSGKPASENLLNPRFVPIENFAERCNAAIDALDGGGLYKLHVYGPPGSGKSRAIRELLNHVKANREALIVREGRCSASAGPYAVFHEALASPGAIGDEAAAIAEELAASVVSIFMPTLIAGGFAGSGGSTREPAFLATEYLAKLRELADRFRAPIILVLHDIQEMDDASREMLEHLVSRHERAPGFGLCIILSESQAPGSQQPVQPGWTPWHPGTITHPAEFLVKAFDMEPAAAATIAQLVETHGSASRQMLIDIVRANEEYLEIRDGVLTLQADVDEADLHAPEQLKDLVKAVMARIPIDVTWLLQLAACVGRRFDVADLAEALGDSTHVLLERIESAETAGIIRDVVGQDDIWEFSSSVYHLYLLECLAHDGKLDTPRQRRSAYHKLLADLYSARVASAEEAGRPAGDRDLFAAATHALAGGAKYAAQAGTFALKAARRHQLRGDCREALALVMKTLKQARSRMHAADEFGLLALGLDLVSSLKDDVNSREALVDAAKKAVSQHPDWSALAPAVADRFLDLVCNLALLFICQSNSEGPRRDGRRLLAMLEARFEALSPVRRIEVLRLRSLAAREEDIRKALSLANSAVEEAEQLVANIDPQAPGNSDLVSEAARAYNMRAGALLYDETRRDEALCDYQRSLELKTIIQDKVGMAMSLGGIGRCYLYGTDEVFSLEKAASAFERDLELSRETGDVTGCIKIPCFLGHTYLRAFAMDPEKNRDAIATAKDHYNTCIQQADHYGFGDSLDAQIAAVGVAICDILEGRKDVALPAGITDDAIKLAAGTTGIDQLAQDNPAVGRLLSPRD